MSYLLRNIRSLSSVKHARSFMPSVSMRYKSAQLQMQPLKSIDDIAGIWDWDSLSSEEQTAQIESLITNPFDYFEDQYQKAKESDPDAPMYKSAVIGMNSVSLLSHDLVKQWQEYELRGKTQRTGNDYIVNLVGKIFTMYGKEHSNWRTKAAKGFKPNIIDQYSDFIQSSAQNVVLEGIYNESMASEGSYIQMYQKAKTFSFEVGSKFTMGPLLDDNDRKYMFPIFQDFVKGISPEAFGDMEYKDPDSAASQSIKARDKLIEYLTPLYRKATDLVNNGEWESTFGDDNDCLIRGLIEHGAFDDVDGKYEEKDLVQNIVMLMFAAYDTTATSMTNLVYAMNKHPKETNELRKYIESDPVLSNPETKLDLQLLSDCVPLNCFIDEVNRMYGIIPAAIRQVRAEEGLDFGGYLLPKDTFLTIPIRWLHQGESSWTDSFEFIPERHNTMNGDKKERGDIGRYNNIPFMTGIHKCLGIHLAKHELRMYTVLLLRDWSFEIDEAKLKESVGGMSFEGIPHFDVWIKLKKLHQQ